MLWSIQNQPGDLRVKILRILHSTSLPVQQKKFNISAKRSDRRIDAINLMKPTTALLVPRAIQNSVIVCATITPTRKCNKS